MAGAVRGAVPADRGPTGGKPRSAPRSTRTDGTAPGRETRSRRSPFAPASLLAPRRAARRCAPGRIRAPALRGTRGRLGRERRRRCGVTAALRLIAWLAAAVAGIALLHHVSTVPES